MPKPRTERQPGRVKTLGIRCPDDVWEIIEKLAKPDALHPGLTLTNTQAAIWLMRAGRDAMRAQRVTE